MNRFNAVRAVRCFCFYVLKVEWKESKIFRKPTWESRLATYLGMKTSSGCDVSPRARRRKISSFHLFEETRFSFEGSRGSKAHQPIIRITLMRNINKFSSFQVQFPPLQKTLQWLSSIRPRCESVGSSPRMSLIRSRSTMSHTSRPMPGKERR